MTTTKKLYKPSNEVVEIVGRSPDGVNYIVREKDGYIFQTGRDQLEDLPQ